MSSTDITSSHPFWQSLVCCGLLVVVLWGGVGAMLLCADLLRQVGQPSVMQPMLRAVGE